MTVQQLIDKLQEMDPRKTVYIRSGMEVDYGGPYWFELLKVKDILLTEETEKGQSNTKAICLDYE